MSEVVIVDGCGANLASLQFALQRLGAEVAVTRDFQRIAAAQRVILPGVGAAADAMQRLADFGLADRLSSLTQPVLGICLGMQLLFDGSDEGDVKCLGVIGGQLHEIRPAPDRPVPHMGWNRLRFAPRCDIPLLEQIPDGAHCYFVHSFAAPVTDDTLSWVEYGEPFTAVVGRGNFLGVQFHPERSGPVGARILENFLRLPP